MFPEEEIQILKQLGLTLLQSKVYLTLENLEDATAGEIAKISKVARQEVYRIINELSELGLVSRVLTNPYRFKPLPLKEGVSVLFDQRVMKFYELQTKVRELIEKGINKRTKFVGSNYEFRIIPENAPWFRNNQIRFATYKTFDLLTSVKRFSSRILIDKELFRKGAKEGKKIRIMTEKPQHNSPILPIVKDLEKNPSFGFRYKSTEFPITLIITDQKEVALALEPSERVGPPYLISNHPSYVHMAQKYFDMLWLTAKEIMH